VAWQKARWVCASGSGFSDRLRHVRWCEVEGVVEVEERCESRRYRFGGAKPAREGYRPVVRPTSVGGAVGDAIDVAET